MAKKERSLEETPTWAVAVVCFSLVAISIVLEYGLHLIGHWLKKKNKPALCEALEKLKAELMVMGFISLLLTVGQAPISGICVPNNVGRSWHPCEKDKKDEYDDKCIERGQITLVSAYGIHQLHVFIFVLAIVHILYCITTLGIGTLKMRKWKKWEDETKTIEYQYYHDPERFRFARDTSFGRRHLNFWSQSKFLLWIVCFFRQFITSVTKVDYMTLRHGFIAAHLAPQSQINFDFQKYINRSLEEDFKVVVGISPLIWLFAVMFFLTNTHGWFSYLWLPFIPLIILLVIGTKLQLIITRLGLRIQERGEVIKGTPVVQPGDDLFWFKRPRLILLFIHVVLFTNAFQIAFFIWSWYSFGLRSCYHQKIEDITIRLTMGVVIQVLCSYVTLPLYALVTQMGSSMKPVIFGDKIATALKSWRQIAKKNAKNNHSNSNTPFSSRPGTPLHGMSPLHLLRGHDQRHDNSSPGNVESLQNTRRAVANSSNHDDWDDVEMQSSRGGRDVDEFDVRKEYVDREHRLRSMSMDDGLKGRTNQHHDIDIQSKEFSFNKDGPF
ncbi:MLO-like protein 12 [Impatiens glandulifera]|uniref:MLO-like protein 12 n=1 Tax=Impatiens glandulifera TaxID=253017 RepID=UPI001FB0FE7E|nr:MLO-like protein 12 [Impatiens glandulifera]